MDEREWPQYSEIRTKMETHAKTEAQTDRSTLKHAEARELHYSDAQPDRRDFENGLGAESQA